MKKFLLSSALLFSLLPLFSQGRFVKCNIQNEDNSIIQVSQTSEKTDIIGNIQRTKVELIITNSSNRILEGEFEFPLEEGESVTGFALDINGKMRQAVAVEKEKGRIIFEDTVRKSVDPGLVEMTSGNSFKTRIYPIPANGFRKIQLTFEKRLPSSSSQIKKDVVFTETIGRDTFFYCYPNLSELEKRNNANLKELPKSICVYYDISNSEAARNKELELQFLKDYLTKIRIKNIETVTFSNTIHERKNFSSIDALICYLENQTFDGGTNLNLNFSKETADQILLFSDGVHNFGNTEVLSRRNLGIREKVVAINSTLTADYNKLHSLAAEVINLNTNTSMENAISQLLYKKIRLLKIEYDNMAFSKINPEYDYSVPVSDDFCLSGILNSKSGNIKLSFGYDDRTVLFEKEYAVSAFETRNCIMAENVSRLWATERISQLTNNYNANKNEILSLAKKYTVVTQDTSLIVLETAMDYFRNNITPPDDLLEEYNRIATRNTSTVKNENNSGISAEVYKTFKDYKDWWNTSPKEFRRKLQRKPKEASPIYYDTDSVLEEAEIMYESPAVVTNATAARRANNISESKAASINSNTNSPEAKKASVTLQAWSSNADYLTILKKTPYNRMYDKYLELKKDYETSPAFYIEVADYFYEENLKEDALRIISNLAEMNLENTDILRALGNKLNEWKEYLLACTVFEKLVSLRSEIPQFLRDLGLAYNNAGETQKAVDTLWKIVETKWDSRFSQIQQTALNDLNSILALSNTKLDTSKFDKELLQNFDVDIRIVLTWNTDDCDIDLWVTDPDNEKCYYGHKLTLNGGRMSRDFTQGYGPEEFAIKVAPSGKYIIQANYFANHQQKLLQPIIVQAEVYTNFGRPNQTCQLLTLQLNDIKNTFDIGEIIFR